jgi:hypothetical protein
VTSTPARRSVDDHAVGPFDVKRAAAVGTVAVLMMAGAAFGAYAMAGDVPRGTRVLGLDLGAMSRTEAEHALADRVAAHAADPVRIRLDGRDISLRPAELDLRVAVDATVGRAMKGGVRLRGHRDVAPVVWLDRTKLEAALRSRGRSPGTTMRGPGVPSEGSAAQPAYPAGGPDFDPVAAADAVRRAWPVGAVADVSRPVPD